MTNPVTVFLDELDHPLSASVSLIRDAIRSVRPDAVESMKWKAPNYALADDFATFNLRRPQAVQLILHTGAKPKPEHPEIVVDDPQRLVKWASRNRAILTFTSDEQVRGQLPAITEILGSWTAQLR